VTWPRLFHRIWLDEPERPEFLAWKDRLQDLHPDWEIRTWNDSSELTWLKNQALFDEWLKRDPFGRAPDILRYELLWRFGGVYIDTDFEPLKPFDPLLEDPRPFAAWENDQTMCTAILASPPEHPAIGVLMEGLDRQLERTRGKPANYAAGPEWATAHWRNRADVRRLPPMTFYPVGWWEKERLGGPYPDGTYAVHHWAKGWGADKPKDDKVVIFVPYRGGDAYRERNWAVVRPYLERLGWPIYLGDSDGPWSRAQALNRAAEVAGDWDVAVIVDADTVQDENALRRAVEAARQSGAVVPWHVRWKLSDEGTQEFERVGPRPRAYGRFLDRTDRTPRRLYPWNRGGAVVIARWAWETVGGFDESFVGWGHEDTAQRLALQTLAGLVEMRSECWHLWHPLPDRSTENLERLRRYEAANGDPDSMRELLSGALAAA